MQDDSHLIPCSVCSAIIDRRELYACLGLALESLDEPYNAIDVTYAGEVASCCGPKCLRQLWARLASILPDDTPGDLAEEAIEMLARAQESLRLRMH